MKKRFLLLLQLPLAALLALWWWQEQRDPPPQTLIKKPTLRLLGLSYSQFDRPGGRVELRAGEALYEQENKRARLRAVVLNQDDRRLAAETASFQGAQLWLRGRVQAEAAGYRLQTDALHYDLEQKTLTVPGPLTVNHAQGWFRAAAGRWHDQQFFFSGGVESYYQPAASPVAPALEGQDHENPIHSRRSAARPGRAAGGPNP